MAGLGFHCDFRRFLCYNRSAVQRAAQHLSTEVKAESDPASLSARSASPETEGQLAASRTEDPSRYCPVCSHRLESRRCKLICSVCGYYMSCADYY